ncbi:MAG: c-type cytochrome [Bacteroidota bacterium]
MTKLLVAASLLAPLAGFAASAEEGILGKAGCLACHAKDKKLVGPAYNDVAAKYKGQGDALAKLTDKVRKGGAGVWGPIPMPPNSPEKISDADLKAALAWILKGA